MRQRYRAVATTATLALLLGTGLVACSADPEPTAADRAHDKQRRKHHGQKDGGKGTQDGSTGSPAVDGSPDTDTVPVYWVGDGPQGPRLYREFRQVPAGDPLAEAVGLLTSGEPLDPDYRSLVTGLDVQSVSHDGATYVLDLGDTAPAPPSGMSRAEARLAVQQLVYTVQGVGQTRDPVDVDHLWGEAGLVTNADPLRTLSLVSVTSPEQGVRVSGTFTASGVASSFEATVPWEVRQGSTVVKRGFSTAEGWMDKLYPWEAEVDVSDLAPGDYTFVAMTDDPSGGEGGGPSSDTKAITVR